jgi:hypothetical protein
MFRLTCKYYYELDFDIEFWNTLSQKELNFTPFVFPECWDLINNGSIGINPYNKAFCNIPSKYIFNTQCSKDMMFDLMCKIVETDSDIRNDMYKRVISSPKNLFIFLHSKMNWNKICELSRISKHHRDQKNFTLAEIFCSVCKKCKESIKDIRRNDLSRNLYLYDKSRNLYCFANFNIIVTLLDKYDIMIIGELDNCGNINPCSEKSKKIFKGTSDIKFMS